jgi:ABC-type glutathione transport system ATPase component
VTAPLLRIDDVGVTFRGRRELLRRKRDVVAVAGVSFDIVSGETVAIVGESGSGKTTLMRAVLGLVPPTHGSVVFDGVALAPAVDSRSVAQRRALQVVFQDPFRSLSRTMTVAEILAEPLRLHLALKGRGTRHPHRRSARVGAPPGPTA